MRRTLGGASQSQNLPLNKNTGVFRDFAMYRAMVVAVKYTNDANLTENSENPRVLYDVVVLGGQASGRLIQNCRLSSDLGENDNYSEIVLKATTKKLHETPLAEHDGAIVYVLFNQGMPGFPVIVRCDQGLNTVGKMGATTAEGQRSKWGFNGVVETIDADGNLTLELAAGKTLAIGTAATELLDVLSQTLEFLATATTATLMGPQPLSIAASAAALKVQLDLLKGSI